MIQNFPKIIAVAAAVLWTGGVPTALAARPSGPLPEAMMVVEAHSGKVLIARGSTERRAIASLTKIATGVVALDWAKATGAEPDEIVAVVPREAAALGGPNPMGLKPGDRMSLRDALYSALLGSDNIAALAVADAVGRELIRRRGRGSDPVAVFVAEMNKLSKALGMRDTRFVNPHGLGVDVRKHRSSAADLARLSIYAMRRPGFAFIVRQKLRTVSVETLAGKRCFKVRNTNELLGEQGVVGIKTGYTAAAGQCLATCVERDPLVTEGADGKKNVTQRRLIVIVLGSKDRFGRTRELIRSGWGVYDRWIAAGSPIRDARREILGVPEPQ
jgi:D-alanyl-D-alanine carboxypeptidase (penicillin-binding protein 5/6)